MNEAHIFKFFISMICIYNYKVRLLSGTVAKAIILPSFDEGLVEPESVRGFA